ncbi:MAG: hypothetical protein ACI81L_002710 [Verrucomicrobiales bacterium]|jgi:uncharacterized protein (TIGR03084 family)
MSSRAKQVLADLIGEQDALDDALAGLTPDEWETPTASARWSVADQIGHLAFFDEAAVLAITDHEAFSDHVVELLAQFGDHLAVDHATLGSFRAMEHDQLLWSWRTNRQALAHAASSLDDDDRVVWYGPSMGATSFLTARLMECWAHGRDALDVLERELESTDRIQHIARLGFITRGWSYMNRELEPSETDIAVRLVAPSGNRWNFGNEEAAQSISGSAEDFCLVTTQRSHVDNTELIVNGAAAREWMLIAQAFAGPPTDGPRA